MIIRAIREHQIPVYFKRHTDNMEVQQREIKELHLEWSSGCLQESSENCLAKRSEMTIYSKAEENHLCEASAEYVKL